MNIQSTGKNRRTMYGCYGNVSYHKGPTFDEWMALVEAHLKRKCGHNTKDLPGVSYWQLYLQGHSAKRIADFAITNAIETSRKYDYLRYAKEEE
jgi:hypothetical protein